MHWRAPTILNSFRPKAPLSRGECFFSQYIDYCGFVPLASVQRGFREKGYVHRKSLSAPRGDAISMFLERNIVIEIVKLGFFRCACAG